MNATSTIETDIAEILELKQKLCLNQRELLEKHVEIGLRLLELKAKLAVGRSLLGMKFDEVVREKLFLGAGKSDLMMRLARCYKSVAGIPADVPDVSTARGLLPRLRDPASEVKRKARIMRMHDRGTPVPDIAKKVGRRVVIVTLTISRELKRRGLLAELKAKHGSAKAAEREMRRIVHESRTSGGKSGHLTRRELAKEYLVSALEPLPDPDGTDIGDIIVDIRRRVEILRSGERSSLTLRVWIGNALLAVERRIKDGTAGDWTMSAVLGRLDISPYNARLVTALAKRWPDAKFPPGVDTVNDAKRMLSQEAIAAAA